MTKEELKQEAEEWLCNNLHSASEENFIKAMVDIAEPREKRIAELTDELKALQESIKDYGAGCYENGLRNGKKKLEEQIEKMKCCQNCSHLCGLCELGINGCYVCSKWEVRR